MSLRPLKERRAAGVRRVGWTGPQRAAVQRTVTLQKLLGCMPAKICNSLTKTVITAVETERATKTEDAL